MNNQDIFSLCIEDMAASLELVSELESELGNVRSQTNDPVPGATDTKKSKTEPRAWAI